MVCDDLDVDLVGIIVLDIAERLLHISNLFLLGRDVFPGEFAWNFHYGKDDRVRLCHEKMFEAYNLPENRDLMMNSILYEYLYLLRFLFLLKYSG